MPHLGKMPATYISCGDEDGFLGHALAMTNALTLVDVPTTLSVVEGADHELLRIPERERIVRWLHEHLA